MWLGLLVAVSVLPACKERTGPPGVAVVASDSADQVLFGFRHFITRDGVREGHVEADTAFFYDPTQTTVLRNMKLVFIDSTGNESAVIVSKHGVYKWQSGDMTADTSVVMTSHDGRVLKSEHLFYDAKKKELTTDQPFTYDTKCQHLQGKGFRSDLKFEHVAVKNLTGDAEQDVLLPVQGQECK